MKYNLTTYFISGGKQIISSYKLKYIIHESI